MIREIKKYPDPILKKKCQAVKAVTKTEIKLIDDMAETMYHHQGIGLAASQIGVLQKIALVDIGDGLRVLINPHLVSRRGFETDEEGCLSLPGLTLDIKRSFQIEAEYQNQSGEKKRLKAQGLLARVLQHEIDHLNGILIVDRLPFWQRLRFKFRKQ